METKEKELLQAQEDSIANLNHISKCISVYNMIEKFILDHGKNENGQLTIDTEMIESKDCFLLVNELIYKVLEV